MAWTRGMIKKVACKTDMYKRMTGKCVRAPILGSITVEAGLGPLDGTV